MKKEIFENIYESCNDDRDNLTKLKEEVSNIRESIYSKLEELETLFEKYNLGKDL